MITHQRPLLRFPCSSLYTVLVVACKCVDIRYYMSLFSFQMAAVAALCVQYEADFRPNMTIVVKALQPLLNSKPAGPESQA